MTRRVTGSAILAAAALATALSACGGSTQTSSAPPTQSTSATPAAQGAGSFKPWPAQVFSPYFETWTSSGSIASLASQSGTHYFNLGFLQAASAGSCTLTWDGSQSADSPSYQSEIGQLKQQGGNVALTFGGQSAGNNGTEIADSCTSVSAIAADYEAVINTYHVSRLDMDVELNALNDSAGIERRNKAIAATQAWAASHGYPLQIQFTLPVQPSGLQPNALGVLQNAVQEGVKVTLVNLMTFDYYDLPGGVDMGSAATEAATSVNSQLAALYPNESRPERYAMEGITFLPGIDDNPSKTEVTELSNARQILSFARDHSLGLLSIWAIQRDNGGCPGSVDSNTCSGISQGSWAFSHLVESFGS
jgi:glycosyl hydrolase family 18 (putative chitinase)